MYDHPVPQVWCSEAALHLPRVPLVVPPRRPGGWPATAGPATLAIVAPVSGLGGRAGGGAAITP